MKPYGAQASSDEEGRTCGVPAAVPFALHSTLCFKKFLWGSRLGISRSTVYGRKGDGQGWKTGIKLEEERKPHGQKLVLFMY